MILLMAWRNVNAIYQIYPRSFNDASGDGTGDLKGITERLDYIKGTPESLGADAIWISPFFRSPMRDFGYDVSDYRDVDPLFGTLEDFDELIAEAHARQIKVMMDLVPNHTSSEHAWFQDALSARDSDKRDYYIFRDGGPDGTPPNNWLSVFGGSAWEFHEPTGQYYMHSFLPEQPDLNWENPKVREEMGDILRFWFDRGVDGVRVDAIRWMGKDLQLRNDPINEQYIPGDSDPYHMVRHEYSRNSEALDCYLGSMAAVASEYDDKAMLWEDHLDDLTPLEAQVRRIYNVHPGVAAPFNFQMMHTEFGSRSFARTIDEYRSYLPDDARTFYCFGNHDESRLVTRFGDRQARMLAVLQLMLPGTPVVYYGQELGMQDADIAPSQIRDPFELRVPGRGLGRDPERTPMQWTAGHQAGFSEAEETWLPLAADYTTVNVEAQQRSPKSFLELHRRLITLRKQYDVIGSSHYETAHVDDDLYSFWRSDGVMGFLTILNFSDKFTPISIPEGGVVEVSAQGHDYTTYGYVAPYDGVVLRYSQ